jgi:hypothetical protein
VEDHFFDDQYWTPFYSTWDAANYEWDSVGGYIYQFPRTDGVPGDWTAGYTKDYVTFTLDNITGGSDTFDFYFYGGGGSSPITSTGVTVNDGESVTLNISALTAPYTGMVIYSAGITYSMTDLFFSDSAP